MIGLTPRSLPGVHVHPGLAVRGLVVRRAPGGRNRSRCTMASAKKEPRETLSQDEIKEYDACLEFVSTFGLEVSEAENVVKESFGWGGRKYWRKQRVRCRSTHDNTYPV